jgi:2-polyprenyl-3-methyl-5-hydroxy-6-metoxy-1,4-benzoquinol methylase
MLEGDYTELADAYLRRPGYATAAIDELRARSGSAPGDLVCDSGAGTDNLAVPLARRGLSVVALEPNPRMAELGARQTADLPPRLL